MNSAKLVFAQCDSVLSTNNITGPHVMAVRDGRFSEECDDEAPVLDYSEEFRGLNLIPGLIDCQVNGCGEWLFEEVDTAERFQALDCALLSIGTTRWFGTFISSPPEKIERVLETLAQLRARGGCIGVHFEGPWLNPEFRGCHPMARLRKSSPVHVDLVRRAARMMPVIVTLAPEVISKSDLHELLKIPGVTLSVGHSDASADQIEETMGAHLRGVTHVMNCMPPVASRCPGPSAILMRSNKVWASMILDGHHLHRDAVHFIKRATSNEHMFLISDLMPVDWLVKGLGELVAGPVHEVAGALRTLDGRLAGSSSSLINCVRMAVSKYSIPADEAIKMATIYPANFLGIAHAFGSFATGCHADLVLCDNQFSVRGVFRDGRRCF